jgi:hypothetical protein
MKGAAIPVIFILLLGFWSPIVFAVENSIPPAQGQAVGQLSPQTQSPSPVPNGTLEKVGQVLLVILALSVVFEVALTPVFNWRFFLLHLEGKGAKIPITVILALIVFWGYDLDIIKDLLVSLGYSANMTFGGQILTALLIAGGSDGVLRIFTKLGIRNPLERKEKAEEARQNVP